MNNSPLTSQQEELKKRLEEIRNKRNAGASQRQNTNKQTPRRNEDAQKKVSPTQKQKSPPLVRERKIERETEQSEIFRDEIGSSRDKSPQRKSKPRKRKQNNLVKQLTQADSLKNAIILNEVVSKPIALRYRNR